MYLIFILKNNFKILEKKILAVWEVRPNLGSFQVKIYRGFPKFIKEKYFCMHFQAIVAIDTIVDRGHPYRCLKKHLDIRIAAPKADFGLTMDLRGKN